MRRAIRTLLLVLAASPTAMPAWAGALGEDIQLWTTARLDHGIDDSWTASFTARGRFGQNVSREEDYLLRPYLSWTPIRDLPLVQSLTVRAGYDYLRKFGGRDENRAWQAIQHVPRIAPLGFVHRARLDERWIEGLDGVIWRARYRLSTTRQLGSSAWYGRISDEVFFNLNDEREGPVGGFEQNRAAVSIGRFFGDRLRTEGGYQLGFNRRRGREDEFVHTFFVDVQLATGRLQRESRKEAPVEQARPADDVR